MKNKLSIWILLAVVFTIPAFAGAPEADLQQTALSDSTVTKRNSWTIGLEAANNSSFYGRNAPVRYPYAAATLTYSYFNGFWASATAYQLFDTEDFVDETDVSIGYSFNIGKRINANLSYSHFFFSENAPIVKSVTENALTAYAALDWNILYSSLTTSYFFGNSNDVFLVLENSRYIGLNNLWRGKNPVGLDPKIGITAGTQEFSETYTVERKRELAEKIGGGGLGGIGGGILNPGGGSGNNNGGTTTTTTTETKHDFKVLNYDLQIPLVIMLGNFEIEPTYRYSIPVNKLEGDESKAQSFYSIKARFTF
jgi:hypothetical protein